MSQMQSRSGTRRENGKRYRQKLGRSRLLDALEAENIRLRETLAGLARETRELRDALSGRSPAPPPIWRRIDALLHQRGTAVRYRGHGR